MWNVGAVLRGPRGGVAFPGGLARQSSDLHLCGELHDGQVRQADHSAICPAVASVLDCDPSAGLSSPHPTANGPVGFPACGLGDCYLPGKDHLAGVIGERQHGTKHGRLVQRQLTSPKGIVDRYVGVPTPQPVPRGDLGQPLPLVWRRGSASPALPIPTSIVKPAGPGRAESLLAYTLDFWGWRGKCARAAPDHGNM